MTFYSIFLCIFCVQMSDAYFCIDKVISSLCVRHLSFLAIISLPPHLINVTVWCFILPAMHLGTAFAGIWCITKQKGIPTAGLDGGSTASRNKSVHLSPWAIWEERRFPHKLKWALFRFRSLMYLWNPPGWEKELYVLELRTRTLEMGYIDDGDDLFRLCLPSADLYWNAEF